MRFQGKIVKWFDDKGFGFIQQNQSNQEVFLHISAIEKPANPAVNALVTYRITKDEKGRFKAADVKFLNQKLASSYKDNHFSPLFLLLFFLFSTYIVWQTLQGNLPKWLPFAILAANLIAFFVYFHDKSSAQKQRWRVSENTLHWLSLFGGWGGAYLAQKIFKHKHKKTSFMVIFWLTVFFNCLAIFLYANPSIYSKLLQITI